MPWPNLFPRSPTQSVQIIQQCYCEFVKEAPQSDDVTLLALQYSPLISQPLEKTDGWTIFLDGRLAELGMLKQQLAAVLEANRIAQESIEDTQLIAEEVLTNIIEYGSAKEGSTQIHLHLRLHQDRLQMTFEDQGIPFNPLTEIAVPDLSLDDESRSTGGFGFHLVRALSDQVEYSHRGDKNVLFISQPITKTRC